MLRLRPADHTSAKVETYSLRVPQVRWLNWIRDPYGNRVARATFHPEHPVTSVDVEVELAVDIRPVNPFDFFIEDDAEMFPFAYPDAMRRELSPFLGLTTAPVASGERFEAFVQGLEKRGKTIDVVVAVNRAVKERLDYVIRNEVGVWTPEETLREGKGSCRDSAMLLVACFRRMGLAARFVSGYLVQIEDEGHLPDEPKGMDHDVVDLHAWTEVFLPGGGWVGLDSTSGLFCGEGHIPLACGAEPSLAAPVEGSSDVTASDVDFSMTVRRIGDEPRPESPYDEGDWGRVLELGRQADRLLDRCGVVLTMGGEPTFNSRTHALEPEWGPDALGPSKWAQGRQLAEALLKRLAPGGLMLHRMGKVYPGESLPRWALEVYGAKDGSTLWNSEERNPGRALCQEDARALIERLAGRLELDVEPMPAYEDPWHFIAQEADLPVDVDPLKVDLDDVEERRRLARVMARGLGKPVGFAIPVSREEGRWQTDAWKFRRNHLFLMPGDSPMGLRLPLDSLGGVPLEHPVLEEDYSPDPRLEASEDRVGQSRLRTGGPERGAGETGEAVRTALCAELRDTPEGERLHVFLPPLPAAADFTALVRAIDNVSAELKLPVVLEGYPPARGGDFQQVTVTPDPGVLEVNLPVTSSSDEYAQLMDTVYDAALHSGLHSEKFMMDGRHAGSGGGHHLTFGGPTPLKSPFLQRPDLLASLVTFLQHHPALSYMFTGLFVGPTSQAPRVDEARHDSLYELELALKRCFQAGQESAPWLPDMLLRNLLVDVSGNTHRAELCIDKLFSPYGAHGRQGVVELRAFEMPPHPRLATAQMMLMRGLMASFAQRPYQGELVRWGQSLHDRFLLPHWLWQDFEGVTEYLGTSGLEIDPELYRPFLDLRCPVAGSLQAGDVHLQVRNALEPWHVLGEEPGSTGTSRYVDSSMERLQIDVDGFVPERHAVLVNGQTLPLKPTREANHFVAGVRFRAWAPPHGLQPHLGIHHPLCIEVVDRWGKRSIGACTYHVWHPEGQGFEAEPLTRSEAAARRQQRVTTLLHSAHPVVGAPASSHPDGSCTLDLRRFAIDRPQPT